MAHPFVVSSSRRSADRRSAAVRCRGLVLAASAACAVWLAPAHAQDNSPPKPPEPKAIENAPVLRTYAVLVVIAAMVIGANTIPSKRGHQD